MRCWRRFSDSCGQPFFHLNHMPSFRGMYCLGSVLQNIAIGMQSWSTSGKPEWVFGKFSAYKVHKSHTQECSRFSETVEETFLIGGDTPSTRKFSNSQRKTTRAMDVSS